MKHQIQVLYRSKGKIKLPKFSGSADSPEAKAGVSADNEKKGKGSGFHVNLPKFGLHTKADSGEHEVQVKAPSAALDVSVTADSPDVGASVDPKLPTVHAGSPEVKGDRKSQTLGQKVKGFFSPKVSVNDGGAHADAGANVSVAAPEIHVNAGKSSPTPESGFATSYDASLESGKGGATVGAKADVPHSQISEGSDPKHVEGSLNLSSSTSPSSGDESKSHKFSFNIGKPKKKHRIEEGLRSGLVAASVAGPGSFLHDPKLHFGPC